MGAPRSLDRVPTPPDVLAAMLRSDPARPRLTFYDDAAGPTRGERIELSARVLANWVSKAANALQEELDTGPGSTVALTLPTHWRALYWALATWATGATLLVPAADLPSGPAEGLAAEVLVTADPERAAAAGRTGAAVLVSLAMLARSNPATPPGAMDEARELATYGDVFGAWERPPPGATALRVLRDGSTTDTAYDAVVVPQPGWGPSPRVRVGGDLPHLLTSCLSAWALDGSVVLVREPGAEQVGRMRAEGVTVEAG